jgi:hypothetical protein
MDKFTLQFYVDQGLSTYKIAETLNKSQTTIRYWLNKFNLKTKNKCFEKSPIQQKTICASNQFCTSCGIHITEETGYIRKEKTRLKLTSQCKICISNKTKLKRENNKKQAIKYKGGCCNKCGYSKNTASLEFHHLNSIEKEIHPSKLMIKNWEVIKNEIDKCILLCSNCHREEHQKIDDRILLESEFISFQTNNLSSHILTGRNTGKPSCYICDTLITNTNLVSKKHIPICKSCNSKRTINFSKNGKIRTVEYMGGCCSICRYNKCIRALEFHHIDPSKKSKDYDKKFKLWNFEKQKQELKHCILVCSNCHRELHN